jgi:N-carbamoyl-L-amino-acid hydrolase
VNSAGGGPARAPDEAGCGPTGAAAEATAADFDRMWSELEPLGREPATGGYRRLAWTPADLACREWFTAAAEARGLAVETDRNGNLWAWWGDPATGGAVVTGSHLDSVPDGGGYDGPLGVVSALAAVAAMRRNGRAPRRPIAVAAFSDEEGGRFGAACLGSRLLTGRLSGAQARQLRDPDGFTLAEAMSRAGHDPGELGADPERLARIAVAVELHVEQGRGLVHENAPVGVATGIWPHGRYRLDLVGQANHAGTTPLADRDDPMLAAAAVVLAARRAAETRGGLATVGRLQVRPNATNAVPARVSAWLDARGPDEATVRSIVADVAAAAGVNPVEESWGPAVDLDAELREELAAAAGTALGAGVPVPQLPTGAGHDAGILAAAGCRAGMLFVRNPSGISHAPAEHAERPDCLAGVAALTACLGRLAAA